MSLQPNRSSFVQIQQYSYPASHWVELKRFIVGDETDPKEYFKLADNVWDTWRYARNSIPTGAHKYRIRFDILESFLKPYAKWFVYKNLLGKTYVTEADKRLVYCLRLIDQLIVQRGFISLCEIAPSGVFQELWGNLIPPQEDDSIPRKRSEVMYQEHTYRFWKELSSYFGMPYQVPPIAPFYRKKPTDYGVDESKVIPPVVINQLANKLALHRNGKDPLSRFYHLRLCFLMLSIILGRRFHELMTTPRGSGSDGPLSRYPSKDGSPNGALWFRFNPNKNGPEAEVYISAEWEEIASYCVKELLKYSDEIRDFAAEEERELFILVSAWNRTAGEAAKATYEDDVRLVANIADPERKAKRAANALSYSSFKWWLDGFPSRNLPGIFQRWNITIDGTAEGVVYKHCTHFSRHTRQNILAADPSISRKSLQQDLNHNTVEEQIVYQHGLRQQFKALLEKAKAGQLLGRGLNWLTEVIGFNLSSNKISYYQPGEPLLINLDERWQSLIKNNPRFIQVCRVPCGYCSLPQGPGACSEYLNCLESSEDGCHWFFTDPTDEQLVVEIEQRIEEHEFQYQQSLESGHTVKASRIEILLGRAKRSYDEVVEHTTPAILDRLRIRQQKIRDQQSIK